MIQTIGPILQATEPLIDQVQHSTGSNFTDGGWEIEPRHSISGLDKESAQFAAGYYPSPFSDHLLRGAGGEALRTLTYYPPDADDSEPSNATVQGYSPEGKFELAYDRGYKGAGANCVMPNGLYGVSFNLTNGDLGVHITPRPLGQVRFTWSTKDGTAHPDSSGKITLDKERFEILPVTAFDPREHNLLSYSDAIAWYNNLRVPNKDSTQLEAWLASLQDIKFQDLVTTAGQQAEQAIAAIQAVISDPESGKIFMPADYEKLGD